MTDPEPAAAAASRTREAPDADVGRLARWETAGGGWRVVRHTPTSVTVALLTCGGGEEMERIVSSDPSFLAYVHAWSDDDNPVT